MVGDGCVMLSRAILLEAPQLERAACRAEEAPSCRRAPHRIGVLLLPSMREQFCRRAPELRTGEARRTSAASPAAAASEEAKEADPTLGDGSPSHAEP